MAHTHKSGKVVKKGSKLRRVRKIGKPKKKPTVKRKTVKSKPKRKSKK